MPGTVGRIGNYPVPTSIGRMGNYPVPHSFFSDKQMEAEVSPSVNPLIFLKNFIQQSPDIAQLAPRMVRNVYTGYEGKPYVITPEDKLKMMMDYRDALDHDSQTLRGVFGPIQAP